jgi:phosphatidylinositol-3-phosphatase
LVGRSLSALLLLAVLAIAGCGGADEAKRTPTPLPPGVPSRVALVVLENHEASQVASSAHPSYLTALAHRYAESSNGHGLTHPSLPNYLALVTGGTAGITDDCVPSECSTPGRSLVDQLEQAGVSWHGYMESMPRPCFHYGGDALGRYAQRHNPFAYLTRVWRRPERCNKVVPLARLPADERAGLARFSWITPNLCHDMHDCGVAAGQAWLRRTVPPLLRALGPRGLLIITFDEGTTDAGCCGQAAGGRIVTVLAGGGARRGAVSTAPVDHYSTLATVEAVLGLPRLGGARSAPVLTSLLAPGLVGH